jgi:hypothetical protein
MSPVGSRADHVRTLRRHVARAVIIGYFFLLVTIALTLFGRDGYVMGNGVRWGIWAVAFVPLTAGFAGAVKVLGAGDRGRSARLTYWAAGLLILGVAVIVGSTVIG